MHSSSTVKNIIWILLIASFVSGALAQPINDQFANRIFLQGNLTNFSGTLAGATRTTNPLEFIPSSLNSATKSVWWQWTAVESTPVVIEILNPTEAPGNDGVFVYRGANVTNGPPTAELQFYAFYPKWFLTFFAEAGTNYYFQLAGSSQGSFDFRLVATNTPYLLQQPEDRSISAGNSVLLTVTAASRTPITYQWQFNGTNLPGETTPMLSIDDAKVEQTGVYSVWLTNASGTTQSKSITLTVTSNDPNPTLELSKFPTTNRFEFSLLTDPGRICEIQSTTNLISWVRENVYPGRTLFDPIFPPQPASKPTGQTTTGTNAFSLPRENSQRFFRASIYHPKSEACFNHLAQIQFAKQVAVYQSRRPPGSTISSYELTPFFKGGILPSCPEGGFYSLNWVELPPVCSRVGH